MAGAAALLLTTVAALVAGLILLGQAGARTERQRLRAEANYAEAQSSDCADLARRAVDEYFVQVSENTLLKSPLPGLQPLRKQLLESALKYYKEFVQPGRRRPETQGGTGPGVFPRRHHHRRDREARRRPGHPPPGPRLLRVPVPRPPGRSVVPKRVGPDPPMDRPDAGGDGHPAEALASFRRAAALGEELVASHPEVPRFQADLAWSYNNLGGNAPRDWRGRRGPGILRAGDPHLGRPGPRTPRSRIPGRPGPGL